MSFLSPKNYKIYKIIPHTSTDLCCSQYGTWESQSIEDSCWECNALRILQKQQAPRGYTVWQLSSLSSQVQQRKMSCFLSATTNVKKLSAKIHLRLYIWMQVTRKSTSLSSAGMEALMYRARNTYGVGTVRYHSNFPRIDFSMISTCSLT